MEPKKLEDLSILEINAEIGLRMESIEILGNQLRELRNRRQLLSNQAQACSNELPKAV